MHGAAALLLILLLGVSCVSAQAIQYIESRQVWLLTTRQSSYAMGVGEDGLLQHLYRGTVQLGDLYRLLSPRAGDVTANEYVSDDGKQAVLFAFRHSQQYNTPPPTIYLRGLDERAVYRVESIDGKLFEKQPELSGAYLMRRGLNLNLRADFDSTAVILERIE